MSLNYNQAYNREIRKWMLKVSEYTENLAKQDLKRRFCPVCGSRNSTDFANNGFLDYDRCEDCNLVFMNPSLDGNNIQDGFKGDDHLLMEYFQIIIKFKDNPPVTKVNPRKDNTIKDIYRFKKSGKLLDVGCSAGDFLHKTRFFYQVEGVEVNPYTAAVAARHFPVHQDYLSDLSLDPDYDIVTLNQILYGVPDPVDLFKDILKILKDDGILYVNTPNSDSYAMHLYQGKINHLYGYTTQNVFNRKSLEKLAKLSGFEIKFFRTEWLDIYLSDLMQFFDNGDEFIHKRNIQLTDYERRMRIEDAMAKRSNFDLKDRGNYLVAVLDKQ